MVNAPQRGGGAGGEATLEIVAATLADHLDGTGSTHSSIVRAVMREHRWTGRVAEVLEVFAADDDRMAYLAGGRRVGEIVTWLAQWVDALLSVEEIREIVRCGGWDPEPFAPLARAKLLDAFLHTANGTPRRIRGELAGGWLSDELALGDEEEILGVAREVIASGRAPIDAPAAEGRAT